MSGCLPGVSLQELHYVWMFQHVAYCGFSVNKVVSLSSYSTVRKLIFRW